MGEPKRKTTRKNRNRVPRSKKTFYPSMQRSYLRPRKAQEPREEHKPIILPNSGKTPSLGGFNRYLKEKYGTIPTGNVDRFYEAYLQQL